MDRPEAAEFLHQQKLLAEQLETGNVTEEACTYNKLGSLFTRMGVFEKALELHRKAAAICQAEGDIRAEAEASSMQGVALQHLKR